MSDLTERLRQTASKGISVWGDLMMEAAQEIEFLRAEFFRAALAQPEQEPVAWLRQRDSCLALNDAGRFGDGWSPLYAHPPQRKPLTGLELCEIFDATEHMSNPVIAFARGIERVHGIE